MGGSSKKQTIGYKYHAGMHLALVHGPITEIQAIYVGERTAWTGSVSANQTITVNAPDLFGGEKREGGVSGPVDVMMGGAAQPKNSYLVAKLGAIIPAFRGVVSLVLNQCYLGNNPYLKPWAVKAKSIPSGWYPAKAEIEGDANPAHILYQVLTNTDWGMGYLAQDLDGPAFTSAADTLYAEGLGLSLLWEQQGPIEDFVKEILRHIDGALLMDLRTGRLVLTLARAVADPSTLMSLDPSNTLSVSDFVRPAWGEITNQVSLVYHDNDTDTPRTITLQDMAAIEMQGSVVATTVRYPGLSRPEIANKVAMRELKTLATPLARCTLTVNRTASTLREGDAFRFSWPEYGLTDVVMRVAGINYGNLRESTIRLQAIQDVFSLPDAVYAAPTPTGWVDPTQPPAPPPFRRLTEMPYWTVIRDITGENPSLLNDMDPDFGLLSVQAARPSGDALNYEVWTRVGTAPFAETATGDFTPHAVLAAAVGITETALAVTDAVDLDLVAVNTVGYLGEEAVAVRVIDLINGTITVDRGVLDTVPAAHPLGARLWLADLQALMDAEFVAGETVNAKLLPATGQGTLDLSVAPTDSLTFANRYRRPYPPGNIKVNGVAEPTFITGELSLSWAHRDRTQQTAYLVAQFEGNIGPEAGTTTRIRIFNENGVLVRTVTDLTGTTYTYPITTEVADSGLNRANESLSVEIESVREGLASWQAHSRFIAECRGYGMFYGDYYGE